MYRVVRDQCQEKLRQHFVVVAVPIEGPAKQSFGDIDIFVAWDRREIFPSSAPKTPINESQQSGIQTIYQALGSVRFKQHQTDSASMAIPWPESFPLPEKANQGGHAAQKYYIQVDAHIYHSLEELQWMLFKNAHSDLWSLLGSIVRPYGLTADDTGFHIRIPEIEELNKKEARVLLSKDPVEVLKFLGLKFDDQKWEEPFECEEDIFEYVATCPLFYVKNEAKDDDTVGGVENELEDDKKKLKANDRRRMAYRPIFKKWVEEFLPACRTSGRFMASTTTPPTRDDIRQQAFEHFLGSQSIYESRLLEWRIKRQHETLWKAVIKTAIPTDINVVQRSFCAGALKKIILQGDTSFDGIEAPPSLKDDRGAFDEEAVRAWVVGNWQKVSTVAWRLQNERSDAKRAKAGTKRTLSSTEKTPPADDAT
jgi:hypothetical protein